MPLELAICAAAVSLRSHGTDRFHGYLIAKELKHTSDSKLLTAHGTLYRALGRLEQMGFVISEWEDPQIPADANRPRRRLYAITDDGHKAVADAARVPRTPLASRRPSTA